MAEKLIREYLKVNPRFLRSAQLERDFNDPESLEGYCVTPETTQHLRRLSKGFKPDSSQRAWRITGDFGSGKSSFALLLANILAKPASDLPKEVRNLRDELGLARSASKLLPVLVTGSREPLSIALLRALRNAIEQSSIDGRKIHTVKHQIDDLLSESDTNDRKIISAIERTTQELVSKGLAGGILLIIDELGKFLEYAALHPERQDVYFLQTLGESATRSGKNQLTVIGLLHQGFAVYADKLTDSSQREWEKVAGRYEELVFKQPLNQVALLMANALQFSGSSELRGWKKQSSADMGEAIDLGTFGSEAGKTALTQLAPALYPLHSTVLPVLSKFFRRFGQNERSLFSFLLSSEPYALQDFAQQTATLDTVYRLHDFYDFAAHNFGHRLSGQSFRSHWNHIDAIIRSTGGETEEDIAILKAVGMLNVVESSELAPSEKLISLALGHPKGLSDRLAQLCSRGILFNRGKSGYALWPHTSVNLEQAFLKSVESQETAPAIADVIRDRLDLRPIVARRHYIKTGNLRHCSVQFITAAEFRSSNQNRELVPSHPADGHLVIVLCESTDEQHLAIQLCSELNDDGTTLVAISPPLEVLNGLALELERWHWVERHTPALKDDRFAAEEVSRQIGTISELLDSRLNDYIGFRKEIPVELESRIQWFTAAGSISELNAGRPLQSYLSDFFDDLFNKAPTISNELINRNGISSAAAAARQKLFNCIFENSSEPLLGLPEDKAPPEKSIYLSVLKTSNIHYETTAGWQLQLPEQGEESDPLRMRPAMDAIVEILDEKPDARVSVDRIRDKLREQPYGIRDGLIPLLYAIALKVLESEIAVYEDGEFKPVVDSNLMMRLTKQPQTFEFQLCRLNGIRKELLQKFASILESNEAAPSTLLSIVRPLCLFVDQLPEYSQNTEILSKQTLALRKAILGAKEPAELVFKAIPQALGIDLKKANKEEAATLSKHLSISLRELRLAYSDLHQRMEKAILASTDEAFENLDAWRSSYSPTAENLVVGVTDPELRTYCLKLIDDNMPKSEWLESLGSFLTRCPPSRWKDSNEKQFSSRINELHHKFNRVLATSFDSKGKQTENAIRLAITTRDGNEVDHVVRMNPDKAKQINLIENKIKAALDDDSELTLTALSRILCNILKDKQ